MSQDVQKFLDAKGVEVLWSQVNLNDYPNNETLIAILNAIDQTKADKDELNSKVNVSDITDNLTTTAKNKPLSANQGYILNQTVNNVKRSISNLQDDMDDLADTAATEEFVNQAVETVKNDLLNGAGEAYDTLKELGDLIDENQDAIGALEIIATNKADKVDVYTKTEIDAVMRPKATKVTLKASGWDSTTLTQTVTVEGILADETAQVITVAPVISSKDAAVDAGIYCSAQGENSLTFTYETIPTEDVVMTVVWENCGFIVPMIFFTFEDENGNTKTFQAEEGMTWGEYINSPYYSEFELPEGSSAWGLVVGDYDNVFIYEGDSDHWNYNIVPSDYDSNYNPDMFAETANDVIQNGRSYFWYTPM